MPELPEVETVRRGLAPVLVGARIARVEARRPDLRFPLPERLRARLEGQSIVKLARRAKYLVASLGSGEELVVHLGMTGRFSIVSGHVKFTPGDFDHETSLEAAHDHVVLHLADGRRVVYNDPRRFGFILMMPHGERDDHPLFRSLGVEPLSDALAPEYLAGKARGRKTSLKAFLMDQRIVAGLGNIYVSEALHRARLSPLRRSATLADRKGRPTKHAFALVPAIRDVLNDAISAGGSTLRDYRRTDGAIGDFQNSFAVYGRDGEKCLRKDCKGFVRRRVDAGRATFYCPRCQR